MWAGALFWISRFEVLTMIGQFDDLLLINQIFADFCQFSMFCNSGAGSPFFLSKVIFGIYRSRSRCWTHSKYSPMMTNDRKMLVLESYKRCFLGGLKMAKICCFSFFHPVQIYKKYILEKNGPKTSFQLSAMGKAIYNPLYEVATTN